jgi:hypothetical protein
MIVVLLRHDAVLTREAIFCYLKLVAVADEPPS